MTNAAESLYRELLTTAESISLVSRNHNDELIAVEFCHQLDWLSREQLDRLLEAWQQKRSRAHKEKLSAQFMIVQMTLLMLIAAASAWLIGGLIGILASLAGITGLLMVLDRQRVRQAKQQLSDAERICGALEKAAQSAPN